MEDQAEQAKWIQILNPDASMIKFKMPYPQLNTSKYYCYFNGEIRLQPWTGVPSAETRLIMTKLTNKCYDVCLYEHQIAYFNNQMRLYNFKNTKIETINISIEHFWSKYINVIRNEYGADYCLELSILIKYLKKYSHFSLNTLVDIVKLLNNHLMDKDKTFVEYLRF